jgi:chloride channel 7
VSKWVGDFFTHSYYLALMELKCIPYLDAEPVVNCNSKKVSLELHCAADIMSHPPVVVHVRESIVYLADILLNTNHGGFPVVRKSTNGEEVFFGYINRLQLAVLLKYPDLFTNHVNSDVEYPPLVSHPQLTLDKLEHPEIIEEMLFRYVQNDEFKDLFINLEPYVNQSAFSVPGKFSLERTYITFRTMGLRHMAVVDENNHVIGVITRKDLMGFNMEEKLALKISRAQSQEDLMMILED